jgi:hypothetical protein
MAQTLAINGPVTVAIDMPPDFHLYTGGVYSSRECSKVRRRGRGVDLPFKERGHGSRHLRVLFVALEGPGGDTFSSLLFLVRRRWWTWTTPWWLSGTIQRRARRRTGSPGQHSDPTLGWTATCTSCVSAADPRLFSPMALFFYSGVVCLARPRPHNNKGIEDSSIRIQT